MKKLLLIFLIVFIFINGCNLKEPDLKKLMYNLPGLYRVSLKRKEQWGFRLAVRIRKDIDYRIMRETTIRFVRGLSAVNQAIIKKPNRFLKH